MAEEQTNEQTQEVDPVEAEAREKGWRPQEEWDGAPDDWVDAGEFIRRAPLFKQMSNMRREIKKLTDAVSWQQKHYEEALVRQKNEMMAKLKHERMQAMQESDIERVTQIEEDMEKLRKAEPPKNPAINGPSTNPEFDAWVERNYWYTTDPKLRLEAETYGRIIAEQIQSGQRAPMDYNEILKEVTNYVKREHPDKFGKPASAKVQSGNTESKASTSKKEKYSIRDLPENIRPIAKTIMRSTGMTEAEYMKRYYKENE